MIIMNSLKTCKSDCITSFHGIHVMLYDICVIVRISFVLEMIPGTFCANGNAINEMAWMKVNCGLDLMTF